MGDRDYFNKPQPASRRPLFGAADNTLVLLIAINAFLFIILKFLLMVYQVSADKVYIGTDQFSKEIYDWFILPAQGSKLFSRPWVVLTYMFTNVNVWMFISNMLWLWSFGHILQDLSGNKKLFPLYLYGGFAGALFFLLSVNFVPGLQQGFVFMEGSGAAIMAIAVATTTLAPDYRIFRQLNGGIPLWVLTLVFVVIDFASVGSVSTGVAIAHIAAALMGFVFAKQLNSGRDMGAWMNSFAHWAGNLFTPNKQSINTKEKLFYKAEKEPYQKTPNVTQQKLDTILDKINQHGYAMLTDEEKQFLNRASKEEL